MAAPAPYRPTPIVAQSWVAMALRRGEIVRPASCEQCSEPCRPDAHHDDYTKPLDVRWLCRSCHQRHHAGDRARPWQNARGVNRLIRMAGGDRAVASARGISREALRKWRDNGAIPSIHWAWFADTLSWPLDDVLAAMRESAA